MAVRTLSDLVLETLDCLGVLPAGQTAQVEDLNRISEAIPSILSELARREIVYIPDSNNIPDSDFRSLAEISAYECREKFGITGDDAVALKDKNNEAVAKLKVMHRGRPTYERSKIEYF